MVALVRTLHALDAWNEPVNAFLTEHLHRLPDMLADKQKNVGVSEQCFQVRVSEVARALGKTARKVLAIT